MVFFLTVGVDADLPSAFSDFRSGYPA